MLHIYIDADACPVKNEIYKVAGRYSLNVTVVSNVWMQVPDDSRIARQVVPSGPDAADDWIVEQIDKDDIVITSDIPLASRCLEKGARAMDGTGKLYTEDNIGDSLAIREMLADMREAGEFTGGPAPFSQKDRSRFLQVLDQTIHAIKR